MVIWPVPNDGRFNLLLPVGATPMTIEVVSADGRIVHEQRAMVPASGTLHMDLSGSIEPGMYLVRMRTDTRVLSTVRMQVV